MLLAGCQQLAKPNRSASTAAQPLVPQLASTSEIAAPAKSVPTRSLTVRAVRGDDESSETGETIFSSDDNQYLLGYPGTTAPRRVGPGRRLVTRTAAADESSLFGPDAEKGGAPFPPMVAGVGEPLQDEPSIIGSEEGTFDPGAPAEISLREDLKQLPRMLWDDNLSLYNWQNAIILGAAGGGAVAVRDNLDQRVRNETAEHPLRWGEGSVVLRQFGEYTVQVPALAAVYAVSLWTDDDKLHEFSKAVISAYSLSAMYTVALKGITNTSRPTTQFENGHYGFPSYHASSTFSIAAVIDEYYGLEVALPVYVLAGLVGWSRVDQREHDLSDVLFGSVLGFVVGKTVAAAHLEKYSNFRVTPYYDPVSHGGGVTVERRF
jgi:hypothetical protein